jgi:hypothetical protein
MLKNYKNIRQKPYIYGFSVKGFFFAVGGSILSLLVLITGFNLVKIIIAGLGVLISYLVGRILLTDSEFLNKLIDNKLPKKHSEYE